VKQIPIVEEVDDLRAQVEHLRRVLQAARPYISDEAGVGILFAVDAALSRAQVQP
jgi:hypothetical protein